MRNRVNFMRAAYQAGQLGIPGVVTTLPSQQDEVIGVPRGENWLGNHCSKAVSITEIVAWNIGCRINAVFQENGSGVSSEGIAPNI